MGKIEVLFENKAVARAVSKCIGNDRIKVPFENKAVSRDGWTPPMDALLVDAAGCRKEEEVEPKGALYSTLFRQNSPYNYGKIHRK